MVLHWPRRAPCLPKQFSCGCSTLSRFYQIIQKTFTKSPLAFPLPSYPKEVKDYMTLYGYYISWYIILCQMNVFLTFKTRTVDFVSVLLIFWYLHKRRRPIITLRASVSSLQWLWYCVTSKSFCLSFCNRAAAPPGPSLGLVL